MSKLKLLWTRLFKKNNLLYAAGFFDGEGCPRISKKNRKGRSTIYEFDCCITLTDKNVIDWFASTFGGSVYEFPSKSRQDKGWKKTWQWSICANQANIFLKLILPYLKLKKEEAKICIKFQEHKVGNRFCKRSQDYLKFENDCYSKLKEVRYG